MKKVFSVLLIVVVALTMVACKPEENNNGNNNGGGGNNGGGSTPKIQLSYASFENQEVEALLIAEYEKQNPHVEVVLRTDLTDRSGGDGTGFSNILVEEASIGNLPDVFHVMTMDPLIENKLVLDFADIWDNDPDTAYVLPAAENAAHFGDVRVGMVNGQAIQGMFLNKDLLDELYFDLTKYGFEYSVDENNRFNGKIWNWEQMIKLARDFTQRARERYNNEYYWGIEGDFNNLNFARTLPAMDNSSLFGLEGFDGEQFIFTNQLYIDHFKREVDLYREGIKVDVRKNPQGALNEFGNSNPDNLFFEESRVLMQSSFSYNFDQIKKNEEKNIIFLPFPTGVTENAEIMTASAIGILSISSSTKHPEEAYKLAKFMSWGKEGSLAKIEAHLELGEIITKFPVSTFDEVWQRIEEIYNDTSSEHYLEGLDMIIGPLFRTRESAMDFTKWMPGYSEFLNWRQSVQAESKWTSLRYGIDEDFADYAQLYQDKANQYVTSKLERYKNYPNMD